MSPTDAWVIATTDCGTTCRGNGTVPATPHVAVAPGAEGYLSCTGSHTAPGVDCGFLEQEACEAFSKTLPPVNFSIYQTSALGVYLKDTDYSDNVAGTPNPGWCAAWPDLGIFQPKHARAFIASLKSTQDCGAGLVLNPATSSPATAPLSPKPPPILLVISSGEPRNFRRRSAHIRSIQKRYRRGHLWPRELPRTLRVRVRM